MRRVTHIDSLGRRTLVEVPDDVPESHHAYGLRIGPPSLESLGLPQEQEVRLHNQLHDRGLLSVKDIKHRSQEIFAALQAALRVDVTTIENLYRGGE